MFTAYCILLVPRVLLALFLLTPLALALAPTAVAKAMLDPAMQDFFLRDENGPITCDVRRFLKGAGGGREGGSRYQYMEAGEAVGSRGEPGTPQGPG